MTMVEIGTVGPKGRDFEVETVFRDNDYPEMRTDSIRAWESLPDDVRRGICRDVEIFRRQTAHHVAHATAREIGKVTACAETSANGAGSLFHRAHAGYFNRFAGMRRKETRPNRARRLFNV